MIKLTRPYISPKTITHVGKIMRSGNLVQGRCVHDFEMALRRYFGVKHAIVVSSGTAALHISLMALNIKRGDEVIIPAFTFPATANVIEVLGARPVLVDISLEDYCIDVSKLEKAVTRHTRIIMPVHEFGLSANMDAILSVARKYRLHVVEDAACSIGSEFNKKKTGTFGILGCVSFHPRKIVTTGEGGAVLTNNDMVCDRIRSLRNHGMIKINHYSDVSCAGLNYRMTDFQSVLGLAQLKSIESIITKRNALALQYDRKLKEISWIKLPQKPDNRGHVYQTYHVLIDGSLDRDRVISYLKSEGIETNIGAYAIQCLTYYKQKYGYTDMDYPYALQAYRGGLSLPMGHHINKKIIDTIARKLKRATPR